VTTALALGLCPWCAQPSPEHPRLLATFEVPGEPVSKARARWDPRRSGRIYNPESNEVAEANIGWLFRRAAGPLVPSATDTFGVLATFYTRTSRKRDVDNLLKMVMDALNGLAWKDDAQVSEIMARMVKTDRPARSAITIYYTQAPL
jgi:crossover junction endodeoxyribonuclease RusA